MSTRHQAFAQCDPSTMLLIGVALIGCNSLLLGPILTDVAHDLHASPRRVSEAMVAYNAATATAAFALAPLLDRLGLARALRLGLLGFAVALLVCAAAPNTPVLAAGQALAGIGAGLVLPASYGLAITLAAPGRQSRALGRVLLGWSVSLVAGVPACALASEHVGWRAAFAGLAALACAVLLGARRLRAQPRPATPRPGLRALLSIPGVAAPLLMCLAYMASFYGVYAFLPDHVRALHGLGTGGTGLLVLAYGIGFGVASKADGLLDRGGPAHVLAAALATLAGLYALLPIAAHALPAVLALAVAWGFANHLGLNAIVLQLGRARPESRGALLGLNSGVTYVGATLGVAGAGAIQALLGFAAVAYAAAAMMAAAALLAVAARHSHSSA